MTEKINIHDEYLFISYSSKNVKTAEKIVKMLEKKGNQCFFAPRDIEPGTGYAGEIIKAIEKCDAVILIYTQASNDSCQVLREINAAVSRNKTIIPLRFENVVMNKDMQYYLGVSQWIDFTNDDMNKDILSIHQVLDKAKKEEKNDIKKEIKISGTRVVDLEDLLEKGYSAEQIAMREIEIDYLCIPPGKYNMDDKIEGGLEDWIKSIEQSEYETSSCLVKNDMIIGYCDIYPVKADAYKQLISGETIIRDDMIDIYGFGGTFPAYVAMLGIIPEEEGQANYFRMFDWLFNHIAFWRKKHVKLSKIGISVYSEMLEQFVMRLGFKFVGMNPAKGKIYEVDYDELVSSVGVLARYGQLELR